MQLLSLLSTLKLSWKDKRGQDLIEYALMAGFVAVAAGAIMPGVSSSISTIFSKIASVMTMAASQSKTFFRASSVFRSGWPWCRNDRRP